MLMDIVEKSMEIIANGGDGKSLALMAIQQARAGNYEAAEDSLERSKASIVKAHQAHSELLFYEAEHKDLQVTLLTVHGADYLTAAETIKELAEEIIYLYKEMRNV